MGWIIFPAFLTAKETLSPRPMLYFIGDVGIGARRTDRDKDAELLKGLVEQQGSGLVFVPGRREFRKERFCQTAH